MQKHVNKFIAAWNLNKYKKMQWILADVEFCDVPEVKEEFCTLLKKTSPQAYDYALDIWP